MVRMQIRLTEEQARAARQRAGEMGISLAEFIRRAVDEALSRPYVQDRRAIRERSLRAIGSVRSGTGDLAVNHDKCLEEAYDHSASGRGRRSRP